MADTTPLGSRRAGRRRPFASLLYEPVRSSFSASSALAGTFFEIAGDDLLGGADPDRRARLLFAGSRHSPPDARPHMVASQALHWAAVLVAMYIITVSVVHGMLNSNATGSCS